jgi:hypothetical protein
MSSAHQSTPLPQGLKIPVSDWHWTPLTGRDEFLLLLKWVDTFEAGFNRNAFNSIPPSSTDSLAKQRNRRVNTAERRKPGVKPGHRGHRQILLEPTTTMSLFPGPSGCGHSEVAYHTQQVIELPVLCLEVTHWLLRQRPCGSCGILVSDDDSVYQSWKGLRQTCLAYLIRTAKGLALDGAGKSCGTRDLAP